MNNTAFAEWRKEFCRIQTAIDTLEEEYFNNVLANEQFVIDEEAQTFEETYQKRRQELVAELEAHFAKSPSM